MAIVIECSGCSRKFTAPDSAAGRKGKCKSCGATIEVPIPAAVVVETPSAPDALQELAEAARASGSAAGPPSGDGFGSANPSANWQARASKVSTAAIGRTKEALGDTAAALRLLLKNPAQGISDAYEMLGQKKAFQVGIVCAVLFDLAVLISMLLALTKLMGAMDPFGSPAGPSDFFDASPRRGPSAPSIPVAVYIKLLFVATIPLVSIALAMLCGRKIGKGKGCLQGDVFVAGISLIPFAVVFLAGGLLGPANFEVVGVLALTAMCLLVLTLFHGFRDLAGLTPGFATLAVPATMLLSGYIAKIMIGSIL